MKYKINWDIVNLKKMIDEIKGILSEETTQTISG